MAEHISEQEFRRVHLMIEEGRIPEALAVLEQMQSADEKELKERAYLRAWCYSELEQWQDAARELPAAGVEDGEISSIEELGQTERRKRARYLLLLGAVAADRQRLEDAM